MALALTLLLGAGSAGAQTGDVRASIEAGNQAFVAAFLKGDGSAIGSLYTANAQLFPPQSDVVRSREAIAGFWQGVIDAGIKGVAVTTLGVEVSGDTAYEVGAYTLSGDGGKTLDAGKYVVVWKNEGGQWRLHRDIWNTSLPPAKP